MSHEDDGNSTGCLERLEENCFVVSSSNIICPHLFQWTVLVTSTRPSSPSEKTSLPVSLSSLWRSLIQWTLLSPNHWLSVWSLLASLPSVEAKINTFVVSSITFIYRKFSSRKKLHYQKPLKSENSCRSGGYHCTCLHHYVCRCGETVAHATFSPNIGWTSGFYRRNNLKRDEAQSARAESTYKGVN